MSKAPTDEEIDLSCIFLDALVRKACAQAGVPAQQATVMFDEFTAPKRVALHDSWEAADARWHEIQQRFQHEGWQGPLGRE